MKKGYILLILGVSLTLTGCTNNITTTNTETTSLSTTNEFSFNEKSFDFWIIKQSGGKVEHKFTFTYKGEKPVKITGVPTSCACTSAYIDKTTLNPGDSATLTVRFNPNLHEEPEWKFFKSVTLLTDPKLTEQPEVKIWAQIDLDLGPNAYELKNDHDDDEEDESKDLYSYNSLTPEQFDTMKQDENVIIIDVHIPEQEHITGTDLFIPYNEIEKYEDQLPKDKNTKIILYCRSGSMSRAATHIITDLWYTQVYDLIWWKDTYDQYINNK